MVVAAGSDQITGVTFLKLSTGQNLASRSTPTAASFMQQMQMSEDGKTFILVGITAVVGYGIDRVSQKTPNFPLPTWTYAQNAMIFQVMFSQIVPTTETLLLDSGVGNITAISTRSGNLQGMIPFFCNPDPATGLSCDFPTVSSAGVGNRPYLIYSTSRTPSTNAETMVPIVMDISARGKIVASGGNTFGTATSVQTVKQPQGHTLAVYYNGNEIVVMKSPV